MDLTKEVVNPNPREGANPLSRIFFTYTFPMFKKGYSKTLEVDDLYNPLKVDRSGFLGDRIQRKWNTELEKAKKKGTKPSLMKALVKTFWPEYLFLGIIIFFQDLVARILQAWMLGGLLDYFKPDTDTTKNEALWYAAGIVTFSLTGALTINQYMLGVFQAGMKIRAACCALVYRKALKLSKTALGDTASGKVVNLLSNDVSRFDIFSMFIHQMWLGPLTALVVMGLLYRECGWAGIVGIVVVFIVVPLQSKLSAKYRKQTALRTDERVRLMDEIITGIQVIKMYAWEKPFEKVVSLARTAEIKIITKSSYVRAMFMTFNLFTTRFALFSTLLAMALSGQAITASKVFVIMSYFNILSMGMGAMFVRGISEIAEVIVAVRRLQEFLMNDEFKSHDAINGVGDGKDIMQNYDDIISIQGLTAKWNLGINENALENVDVHVNDGRLFGIIGPVGSGKSSLLNTILGELEIIQGKIKINGTISYASQESWVFAATIRQNILFGAEYDKKRYQEVVRVCALEKDFEQFAHGDLSIVGDRGASLSGGQKARINLARAVYRDTDIYLLDDPLSAVDIHVSKHLYEECINGYLRKKTRILVTHQVHYLKNADHIIILNNGRIEDEGTFQNLANSENVYAKLLTSEPDEAEIDKKLADGEKIPRRPTITSRKMSITSALSELSIVDTLLAEDNDEEDEDDTEEEQVQLKDLQEDSSKGKVHGSILMKYFRAGGNWFFILSVFVLYVATQMAASGTDYWVSYWVNIEEFRNKSVSVNSYIPLLDLSTDLCLIIYGVGIISLFIIGMSRSILFYELAMLASKKLHKMIFGSVVAANMRFFDTNPSGRILNRFSKDIGSVDELLPKVLMDATQILLLMGGSLLLISIVNPFFLILIGFLAVIFGMIRHVFLKSSKNIKRLEGIMRSPVFTHLNATLQGLTTIRAFGAQGILSDEFDKHQDYHTSAWYMFIAASSAFGFYLDLFCALFASILTFSFLTFGEQFGISGGNVGLAISQATALTGLLQWGMRQSAEVSNQLMSVERVLEYDGLPPELEPVKPIVPPKQWPHKGELTFEKMGLRYIQDGPLVLKDLNVVIKPKEKVGVVGRTGAGKSSLITALFRLAPVEGAIRIDDLDTKDVTLATLRKKISIIPQDPVLFSGTLRYNLDPFEEYSDELLYRAIEDVELKDPANVINRLENRVMDRGANYSVGQRQLICLARAIVKNNKILMLDEATANVDPQTDALIQKTIRRKFVDCTVITVAHRLNTIMDSDKVLVMDAGTVLEFDHPHLLLQNKNGAFCKMVAETGRALSEQLRKIAQESHKRYSALPE